MLITAPAHRPYSEKCIHQLIVHVVQVNEVLRLLFFKPTSCLEEPSFINFKPPLYSIFLTLSATFERRSNSSPSPLIALSLPQVGNALTLALKLDRISRIR